MRRLPFPARRQRRGGAVAALLAVALIVPACMSSGNEATPTTAASEEPTATIVAATFTPRPAPTPTETSAATAIPSPTAPSGRQTPTAVTLPSGGAELKLFGRGVEQVVAADEEGKILYAVSGSRVVRSPDGGLTWLAQGRTAQGTIVPALNNSDLLYAGDIGSCAMSVVSIPLSVSTDGGRVWEQVDEVKGVKPLLVEAGDANYLVGTSCVMQISADGGKTWQFVPTTSNYDVSTAASHERSLDGEIVAIGTSEGGTSLVWKFDLSTPGVVVEQGQPATFWGLGGIAWSGDRMILATAAGVGVSNDSGATWTWSRAGLEDATLSVDPLTDPIPPDEAGKAGGFRSVAIDPGNPDRIWIAGPPGLFRSDDGGATWTRLGTIADVDSLAISTVSDRVFAVAGEHMYVWTLDGE